MVFTGQRITGHSGQAPQRMSIFNTTSKPNGDNTGAEGQEGSGVCMVDSVHGGPEGAQ